jgi:translation elongation factor EF-G
VSEALKGAGAKESQALEQALAEGVANGCRSGLFFGFPLEDVRVAVTHLAVDPGVSPTALKAASADAVKQAALAADPTLLEPIMKVPYHDTHTHTTHTHTHHTGQCSSS